MKRLVSLSLPFLLIACGNSSSTTPSPDAAVSADASPDADASTPPDAAVDADAATPDAPSDDVSADDAADAEVEADAPIDVASDAAPPAPTCVAPISLVDTSTPTTVVGSGTAASCTEAALSVAVANGGIITFTCGSSPVTIPITTTLIVPTDKNTTIDGAGLITLDGGGTTRILSADHPDYRTNDYVLTLQRVALEHGKASGTKPFAAAPAPCSQGFYDGEGGAVRIRDLKLHVIDATFTGNEAAELGPDVGGGAIYVMGTTEVIVVNSTFTGNTGSNGGAIGALNSELDVHNSSFTNNSALGHGANSDDASKCSVISETGQHQVGSGGNGGAICIDGGSDGLHTFCGVKFVGNHGGAEALGGAIFRTPDLAKQATVIDRCWFDSNVGGSGGGALYIHNSDLKITDSTLSKNSANGSGGMQSDGTTIDFTNVTFAGNVATGALAAGFALFGGNGSMVNCTFVDNVCQGDNMFACAIFGSPTLDIRNTIFAGNLGTNPTEPMQCRVGAATTGSGNLQWPPSKVANGTDDQPCAPGIVYAEPSLEPLGDNGGPVPTMLPSVGSAAIGVGTNCPATDARGKARPANGCSAGAAER